MNPDRIISDFALNKLLIDFMEMSLVQDKAGDGAIAYRGKGYVRQTEEDALTFKLYATETRNTDVGASLNSINNIKSGELFPDDAHYVLSGIAQDGSTWCAEGVLPQHSWNLDYPNPIAYGKLSSFSGGYLLPDPKAIAIHFFETIALPGTVRNVTFEAVGCEFEIKVTDGGFIVRANSDESLPDHFAIRVEEALRFVLARSVQPRAIVQRNRIVLTSATLKSTEVRLPPPISRGAPHNLKPVWDQFRAYLDYVLRETKFENWNPCTGYLNYAHEASANSLEAWAIGLGVAVEGLASMIEFEHDKAKVENLKELQNFIINQVSTDARFQESVDRIRGLVGRLTDASPTDRMRWLAENGGTNHEHIKAWQRLRNRGVHPKLTGDVDIASLDFQKYIDEINCVTALLYHIVFHLIGYRGPYTDYATRDFPVSNYPLTEVAPESP